MSTPEEWKALDDVVMEKSTLSPDEMRKLVDKLAREAADAILAPFVAVIDAADRDAKKP